MIHWGSCKDTPVMIRMDLVVIVTDCKDTPVMIRMDLVVIVTDCDLCTFVNSVGVSTVAQLV